MDLFQFWFEKLSSSFPNWINQFIIWVASAYFTLKLIAEVDELWQTKGEPLYYKIRYWKHPKGNKRQQFAEYIIEQLSMLDRLEEWTDNRFAELEAEVEADDSWWSRGLVYPFKRKKSGLHREKSISIALTKSSEKLILLEGDPGSGKSIALRHLARKLATSASKTSYPYSVIPLYVNLRGLERQRTDKINGNLVREYVLLVLTRVNDRNAEEFLEAEFTNGLLEKTWLFLFDSFDEIPEILSSTEADKSTSEYAMAIEEFMSGMNGCRAIIASRAFKGPSEVSWPSFRILSLTEERQQALIKKAVSDPEKVKIILGSLPNAGDDIQRMRSNPMFLALLCEHVQVSGIFPQNSHSIFESYITTRLSKDEKRLRDRFNLSIYQLRHAAEVIAFAMTADLMIGLSPTRGELAQALDRQDIEPPHNFYHILDALEYLKLGRSETILGVASARQFSFSHRRFQEYFATCIVLQEPHRVPPPALLNDARWRETCVTLLHTRSVDINKPIINHAERALRAFFQQILIWQSNPIISFKWPEKCLYTIKLLQDGLSSQINLLPNKLQQLVKQILIIPFEKSILIDRKMALEVSGLVPAETLNYMIVSALNSPSSWLQNFAYKQLGKVRKITPDVDSAIRYMLLIEMATGGLWRKRHSIFAQLARLPNPQHYKLLQFELLIAFIIFHVGNILSVLLGFLGIFITIIDPAFTEIWSGVFALLLFIAAFGALSIPKIIQSINLSNFWTFNSYRLIFSLLILFLGNLLVNPLLLIYGYVLIWPFFVFMLTYRTGKYANPRYWLFVPIVLIFDLINSFMVSFIDNLKQVTILSILKAFKKVSLILGPVLIGLAILIGLFILIIFMEMGIVRPWVIESFFLSILLVMVVWGIYSLYKNILLFGLKGAVLHLLYRQKEMFIEDFIRPFRIWKQKRIYKQRYEEFISKVRHKIDIYTFFDLLSGTRRHALIALKRVMQENLLLINNETVTLLRLLSKDIETALIFHRNHHKTFRVFDHYYHSQVRKDPPRYVNWLRRFQENHPYFLGEAFDFAFLDELNKLIEQVEFASMIARTDANGNFRS